MAEHTTTNSHFEGEEGTTSNEPMEIQDGDSDSDDQRCVKRRFFNAIESDDFAKLEFFLTKPKYHHLVNAQDKCHKDNTPLHMAINRRSKKKVDKHMNKKIIDYLISKNAAFDIKNRDHKTAFDLIQEITSDPYLQVIKPKIEPACSSTKVVLGVKRPGYGDDGPEPKVSNTNSDSRTDPNLDRVTTHRASGVKRALDGIIYQAKLLGLFAKRGKDEKYDFRLATEMDAAGKFDDVVFSYRHEGKNKVRYLQAKHKQNPKMEKIKLSDLLSTCSHNPFSLQKYLISFCNIKEEKFFEEHEKVDFTIVTNTDFAWNTKQKKTETLNLANLFEKMGELEDDDILLIKSENFRAEEYKFSGKQQKQLKAMMKESLWENAINAKISYNKKNTSNNDTAIKNIIRSIRVINSKERIDHAGKRLQDVKTEWTSKKRKKQMVDWSKTFSAIIENILGKEECQALRQAIDKLQNSPAKNKKDRKFIEACEEVLNKCESFLLEVKTQFTNGLSDEMVNERHTLVTNLKEAKSKLTNLSKKCIDGTSVDEIKQEIGGFSKKNDILSAAAALIETKKKSDPTLDKIMKTTDEVISEISVVLLALNDEKIDEYFEEFVEKFRIVVRYPNEQELGGFIKEQLGESFDLLNAELVGDSFEIEMLNFLKKYSDGCAEFYSWKSCEDFFNKFERNIRTLMTSGLSIIYPEELRSYDIVVKEHLTELSTFFNANDQIMHIETKYPLLSAIKVLQTLESHELKNEFDYLKKRDGFMFFPLKTLLLPKPQEFIVQCFSAVDSHHILVIEYQSNTSVEDEQKKYLFQILLAALENADGRNKKIIMIAYSKEAPTDLRSLYSIQDAGIRFDDLTAESQRKILEREIMFQGKAESLNRIIDEVLACKIIDQDGLAKLVGQTKIQIGDEKAFVSPGYEKDYYIKRNLHRQKIEREHFEKNCTKYFRKGFLFFITGANDGDINNLRIEQKFIQRWQANKMYKKGIVFPPSDENNEAIFNELCARCIDESSVHWLEFKDGNLFWRKFKGNMFMAECLDQYYVPSCEDIENGTNILSEELFINPTSLKPKVIILANDSGMGKSVALTSIARNTIKFDDLENDEFHNLWIIRINFSDHAKVDKESCLGHIEEDWNKNNYIEFVSKMAIPGNSRKVDIRIQRELFKEILLHPTKDRKQPEILIHFDGFDEICSLSTDTKKFRYSENTIALLKMLKQECHVTQFWVTTRLHEKVNLEKELETAALILNPLSREEQEEFSNKFCKWNLQSLKAKFARGAVKELKDRLIIIDESLKQLNSGVVNDGQPKTSTNKMSIQKLIMDISDILQKLNGKKPNMRRIREKIINLDFSQYVVLLIDKLDKEFTNVPLHIQMLVEIISEQRINFMEGFGLVDLYSAFVQSKFNYHMKKNEMSDANAKQAKPCEENRKNLQELHIQLAKNIYMPKKKEVANLDKNYITKPGLVKRNDDGSLYFVRPTYAEYFFNEYLLENFRLQEVQKVLFNNILLKDECVPIRQLFNARLERLYNSGAQKTKLKEEKDSKRISKDEYELKISQLKGKELASLLSKGIELKKEIIIKSMNDGSKRTIVHVMVAENLTATLRFLFHKFKNEKDVLAKLLQVTDKDTRYTALQSAIGGDSADVVTVLLECMKENLENVVFNTFLFPNNSENPHANKSILHIAVEFGKIETIRTLLEWMEKNLDKLTFNKLILATDKNGETVLDFLKNSKSISGERYDVIVRYVESLYNDLATTLRESNTFLNSVEIDVLRRLVENEPCCSYVNREPHHEIMENDLNTL